MFNTNQNFYSGQQTAVPNVCKYTYEKIPWKCLQQPSKIRKSDAPVALRPRPNSMGMPSPICLGGPPKVATLVTLRSEDINCKKSLPHCTSVPCHLNE
jgi:hypothetical protein